MDTRGIVGLVSSIRDRANAFIVDELAKNGVEGLAPSHGSILVNLFIHKRLTMKELSKKIGRKKNTVTVLVNKLIKEGYIKKSSDPYDARVSNVELTKKAESIKPIFDLISDNLLKKVYKGVAKNEQKEVVRLLGIIYANLE